MKLYIVRHGHPNYQLDCLTELGKKQAESLVPRLAAYGIHRIITSPQGRARETAQPLADHLGITPEVASWAHEIYFKCHHPTLGEFFGTGAPENILRSEEFLALGNQWHEHPFYEGTGAGEEVAAICAATDLFMEKLGYKHEGLRYKILRENEESVALFCHGGFTSVFVSHLFGVPMPIGFNAFDISLSGVCLIDFRNLEGGYTVPRAIFYNDTSHLYANQLDIEPIAKYQ